MKNGEHAEEICVVCCRGILFYAAGQCNHTVCFECSTRMRVLCGQNECPICRSEMPFVLFTHKEEQFPKRENFRLLDKRYMIAFEDEAVQAAFKELLQHRCSVCNTVFTTFKELNTHVRRDHSLHYCELCTDNLKIFTFERKCYTRKDLAQHKRIGDVDDTSHRGHPPCQFCDQRFMDVDDLYRHMRREHLFCHFCDADGKNQYYRDYDLLQNHFRERHYLCEEGPCARERFVGAFRTEIDLKAHIATTHSRNKTKAEVKQTRTLDLEFNITPRNQKCDVDGGLAQNDFSHSRYGAQNYQRKRNMDNNSRESSSGTAQAESSVSFNPQCSEDFPSLSSDGIIAHCGEESNRYSSRITSATSTQPKSKQYNMVATHRGMQMEHFPALSSTVPNQRPTTLGPKPQTSPAHGRAFSSSDRWGKPPLSDCSNTQKKKTNNSKPPPKKNNIMSLDDFPSLETSPKYTAVNGTHPLIQSNEPQNISDAEEKCDILGKKIYEACKSKKKNKTNSDVVIEGKKYVLDEDLDIPELSKQYCGISNANEDETATKLKIAQLNKFKEYKYKSNVSDGWDDQVVPWLEPAKITMDDFPPLVPDNASSNVSCPPGFKNSNYNATPPGFTKKLDSYSSSTTQISLASIARQLNATNSKNRHLYKENEPELIQYSYLEPDNFQKRNNALIERIQECVKSDSGLFGTFKALSGNFKQGRITAAEYHDKCLVIIGKEGFLKLFPELLCLLPDIAKQQELLNVHESFLKEESRNHGAVPKQRFQNSRNSSLTAFSTCSDCKQVLANIDVPRHQDHHRQQHNCTSR